MTVYAMTPHGERTFEGPGLLRKPRVGETLVSRVDDSRMTVLRFDSLHDSLVHVRRDDGHETVFIWRFTNGLNCLVRHEEAA